MKNVFINTDESWWLHEDFKTDLVCLNDILDKYDMLHDIIDFYEQEVKSLKEIIQKLDPNCNYDM